MTRLEVCCIPWCVSEEFITKFCFCLTDGGLLLWCGCGAERKVQAEKGYFLLHFQRMLTRFCVCTDESLCCIEVFFSYQDDFLRPFGVHGCDHLEYPEEEESV